jgi:acetyl esterase
MPNSLFPIDPTLLADATPDQSPVYKSVDDIDLQIHLFLPAAQPKPHAAIVFFFGGGWRNGTPSQFYPHCHHLAQRGMLAAAAEYRVEKKHATPPSACVEDGKSALRYLRHNAADLHLDPTRLAAGGGSAGGHVAAAAANCPGFDCPNDDLSISARPDALVLFNPVFDNGPDGWGHTQVKDYWQDISPRHNIGPHSPPTAVFLGTEDPLIPVTTAEGYRTQMQKDGGRCDLHLYKGQPHGFFNFRQGDNPYFTQTLETADRFLVSLGYLAV